MQKSDVLLLKLPRNTEVTPEAAQTFLSALTQINFVSGIKKIFGEKIPPLALEIVLSNQRIQFQISCSPTITSFVESQIKSSYPLVIIEKIIDPIDSNNLNLHVIELALKNGSYYPIMTYLSFRDVDPLNSLLSVFSKTDPDEFAVLQIALEGTNSSWQQNGQKYGEQGAKNIDGTYRPRTDMNVIKDKISHPGFKTSIRIASSSEKTLSELKSAFGVYARADGNMFVSRKNFFKNFRATLNDLINRKVTGNEILNVAEIATLWHLPSEKIKATSIVWGNSILSEAPEKLPIALSASDETKHKINFFAKTTFKNKDTVFGIKDEDRRRHIWCIGKTGTGKSTLIANMVIDDLKKGRGVAIIDPHGDLSGTILNYIPSSRINDVVYFNPSDKEYPITINPLEVTSKEEAELVVSGIVSIFNKLFGYSWGPRLEYILRNTLLTLSEVPGSTLVDVLTILSDRGFRTKVISKLQDSTLIRFWKEFNEMPDKLQKEAISPIQNKVGQFVTSPLIRSVIGKPKSTIKIDEIMNNGGILIANLSQGKLGEDNAALLGAMLITKIQLAAMKRVDTEEEKRRDFYLFVDEFQNFATQSFIKILSEARKYRLNLMLANQYMAQIPDDVQKAILGNAGSLISFSVGASDSHILVREFGSVFSEDDLVNLSNYQIATRLMIDGYGERPFLATTLPLPSSSNYNKEKAVRSSRERWGRR